MNNPFVDEEVIKLRIKNNLKIWESQITKYPKIPFNKGLNAFVKKNFPLKCYIRSHEYNQNLKFSYNLAKHLINNGVSPSKTVIVSLQECYLSIRGFGELAEVKNKIFSPENQLIIIENVYPLRATDVKENAKTFWLEFVNYLKANKKVNLIMCGDKSNGRENIFPKDGDFTIAEEYFNSINFIEK